MFKNDFRNTCIAELEDSNQSQVDKLKESLTKLNITPFDRFYIDYETGVQYIETPNGNFIVRIGDYRSLKLDNNGTLHCISISVSESNTNVSYTISDNTDIEKWLNYSK